MTVANGGDNIGVYVPLLVTLSGLQVASCVVLFLMLVGVWCLAGWYVASRPPIARALARWGHALVPIVLISVGVIVLVKGGAFGL